MGSLLGDLYKEIKNLGYAHTSNLITLSSDTFETEMGHGKEAMSGFYKNMVDSMNEADICVFEASVSSSGVGFLIDRALSSSKPTIILYYKELKSFLLPGVNDEKMGIYVYDENNYPEILKEAFEKAENLRDKRFNFFINPQLLEYLETVSKNKGMTKSQFIRSLILEHKKKKKVKP
jgi:hypothetical protein